MRQFVLAALLVIVPVGVFTIAYRYLVPPDLETAQPSLGDMSPYIEITTDVQGIASTGDFAAAETRITDFEDTWDAAEATMRPLNPAAWGKVDDAADAVFAALRRASPDAGEVTATLAALQEALADPTAGLARVDGPVMVAGIAVSDETGHPIACEDMIATLREALDATVATGTELEQANDFEARALERCNADDDRNADVFAAQALALVAARE